MVGRVGDGNNMKASSIALDKNISILMKGPWGFGKTLAAASFALEGPVYLAYWDKKGPIELDNYFRRIIKRPDLLDRIEYDIYGASNAGEFLEKLIGFIKDCRYTAVINDSVTNMTSGAVNWSLAFRDNKKGNKGKDKLIPDWDEYKVETSLVTQCLDICRTLPCHIIWTAHPVPGIRIEGSGSNVKVTKVNPIVTYGSKVAGIVPGNFSEIYQFSKQNVWDSAAGKNTIRYIVSTDAIGDDFAKSNLGLSGEFDITDRLFYEVWKEQILKLKEPPNEVATEPAKPNSNPFMQPIAQLTQPTINPTRTWNPEKGEYI